MSPAAAGCHVPVDRRQRMGESAGRQLRRPYFMIHHKPAPATAVMAMDIATDSEISFAHSQYDTHAISGRLHAAPLVLREILATASAVCAKLRIVGFTFRPTPGSLAQNA